MKILRWPPTVIVWNKHQQIINTPAHPQNTSAYSLALFVSLRMMEEQELKKRLSAQCNKIYISNNRSNAIGTVDRCTSRGGRRGRRGSFCRGSRFCTHESTN